MGAHTADDLVARVCRRRAFCAAHISRVMPDTYRGLEAPHGSSAADAQRRLDRAYGQVDATCQALPHEDVDVIERRRFAEGRRESVVRPHEVPQRAQGVELS